MALVFPTERTLGLGGAFFTAAALIVDGGGMDFVDAGGTDFLIGGGTDFLIGGGMDLVGAGIDVVLG